MNINKKHIIINEPIESTTASKIKNSEGNRKLRIGKGLESEPDKPVKASTNIPFELGLELSWMSQSTGCYRLGGI